MPNTTPPRAPHAPQGDERASTPPTTLTMHVEAPLGPPIVVDLPAGAVHVDPENGPYIDETYPFTVMNALVDGIHAAGFGAGFEHHGHEGLWIFTVQLPTSFRRSRSYNTDGRLYLGNLPLVDRVELDPAPE